MALTRKLLKGKELSAKKRAARQRSAPSIGGNVIFENGAFYIVRNMI